MAGFAAAPNFLPYNKQDQKPTQPEGKIFCAFGFYVLCVFHIKKLYQKNYEKINKNMSE
jgi:hypothetical protein